MEIQLREAGSGKGNTGREDCLWLADKGVSLHLSLLCALQAFISPSELSGGLGAPFPFHHEHSMASSTVRHHSRCRGSRNSHGTDGGQAVGKKHVVVRWVGRRRGRRK